MVKSMTCPPPFLPPALPHALWTLLILPSALVRSLLVRDWAFSLSSRLENSTLLIDLVRLLKLLVDWLPLLIVLLA